MFAYGDENFFLRIEIYHVLLVVCYELPSRVLSRQNSLERRVLYFLGIEYTARDTVVAKPKLQNRFQMKLGCKHRLASRSGQRGPENLLLAAQSNGCRVKVSAVDRRVTVILLVSERGFLLADKPVSLSLGSRPVSTHDSLCILSQCSSRYVDVS